MNRRLLLKNFALISAGATILPSCFQGKNKSSLALKNINISEKEEAMLAQISDTILPKTDTPGAKDAGAYLFALMMVDECFDAGRQQKFMKGLQEFNERVNNKFAKTFTDCTTVERTELLKGMQNNNEVAENAGFFYNTMKSLTIQAYTTSQYFLTKVHEYKLVPGKFYGCVPVKKTNQ